MQLEGTSSSLFPGSYDNTLNLQQWMENSFRLFGSGTRTLDSKALNLSIMVKVSSNNDHGYKTLNKYSDL